MTDDQVLIKRLKQGDQSAFGCIYVKYRPRLMAAVRGYRVDTHQAEDILHDVFVSVLGRIERHEITRNLYGYLRSGALNSARDTFRRRRREKARMTFEVPLAETQCSPCERSIHSEESQRAQELLGLLPNSQREVVCMRIGQGLRFEQIAKIQGVSSSTARGRYRYGISRLQNAVSHVRTSASAH